MASILEFAGVHYFTKVGYGESFGQTDSQDMLDNDDDDEEENEDDDWEDLEEWGTSDPPISISSRWSSLPHCPPPPALHLPLNNINHINHVSARPPTPSHAFNHVYGVDHDHYDHHSLSDSTESLPAPGKHISARLLSS